MRRAGGNAVMILFNVYRENPSAPVIRVTNFGGMFKVGTDILVTVINEIPNSRGQMEAFAAAHLVWPERAWCEAINLSRYAQDEYRHGLFSHYMLRRAN
jgi:hypothetical protein